MDREGIVRTEYILVRRFELRLKLSRLFFVAVFSSVERLDFYNASFYVFVVYLYIKR